MCDGDSDYAQAMSEHLEEMTRTETPVRDRGLHEGPPRSPPSRENRAAFVSEADRIAPYAS